MLKEKKQEVRGAGLLKVIAEDICKEGPFQPRPRVMEMF